MGRGDGGGLDRPFGHLLGAMAGKMVPLPDQTLPRGFFPARCRTAPGSRSGDQGDGCEGSRERTTERDRNKTPLSHIASSKFRVKQVENFENFCKSCP